MTGYPPPEAVLDAMSRLLCRLCEQDRLNLSPDMALEEIIGIDSLRVLQAVALLEEHFNVEVDVVALDDLHRVRDIVKAISNARPASPAGTATGD